MDVYQSIIKLVAIAAVTGVLALLVLSASRETAQDHEFRTACIEQGAQWVDRDCTHRAAKKTDRLGRHE